MDNESILPESVIKSRKRKILEKEDMKFFFVKVVLVVVVVLLVFNVIYGIKFAEGQDMYPSIKDGDVVFYFRINSEYNVDDVIVLKKSKQTYTSRIVAREGDVVDITEDGQLIINNNPQQERIFFETYPSTDGIVFPYRVSKGSVFVLGDFRTSAIDSRDFGEVSLDEIEGKVITILRRRGF